MILHKNIYIASLFIAIFFSACNHEPIPVEATFEVSPVVVEEVIQEEVVEEVEVELTPLEMCAREENKYNLIVNASQGSKIRILNIQPKYKNCIALKKGKYNIEVKKKGYMIFKEWVNIESDLELDVVLIELLDKPVKKKKKIVTEKSLFNEAKYNKKRLQRFIKRYPHSTKVTMAKKRINDIDTLFYGYSPHSLIKYSGCIGFYPKNLIRNSLQKSVSVNYWERIRWNGSCENRLMHGRGVMYFQSKKGLEIELRGKMKNGFFDGTVYNSSNANETNYYMREDSKTNNKVKLNDKKAFINYQK